MESMLKIYEEKYVNKSNEEWLYKKFTYINIKDHTFKPGMQSGLIFWNQLMQLISKGENFFYGDLNRCRKNTNKIQYLFIVTKNLRKEEKKFLKLINNILKIHNKWLYWV